MKVAARPGSSPWSYALRGIVALLFGAAMLLTPGIGLAAFVLTYGIFSLVDGVIAAIGSFIGLRGKRVDWGLLLAGLLSIGVGLFFVFRPLLSITALSLFVALWFIATGIATLISAIQYRKVIRGEWLLGLAGVVAIGFGIYLLARPIVAVTLLPLMIGGYALVWGILLLGAAFRLWRHRERAPTA